MSESPFRADEKTRVVEGPLAELGALTRELGRRVLLVTDPGIVAVGHAERARAVLADAGLEVEVFSAVDENPTTEHVDACARVAREFAPEVFCGVGGGSAIDVAKGADFLFTCGGEMADYWGPNKATRPLAPLVAVPTTAGTGTEVQSFALIAQAQTHRKMACGDPSAAPKVALLDATLTTTLPPFVTACTGLDAIGHAVESAVSKARTDVSFAYSREAFRLAAGSFRRVVADPQDLSARADMLRAAALAGLAIEHSMLGAAHSMANPLTAHFDIAHGQAVGMCLPAVVRFNADREDARETYRELAVHAGLCAASTTATEAAEVLARELQELVRAGGLPTSLAECGVSEASASALADEALEQWTAQFNPREVAAAHFADLFRETAATG